jgi:GTP-binding protein
VRGTARNGMPATLLKRDGKKIAGQIAELQTFVNLKREKTDEAPAGEIVCVVGLPQVDIGDTIAGGVEPESLPYTKIEEPTLAMMFMVNDSPFAGTEGKFITSRHLRDRLHREMLSDVALRVEKTSSPDEWRVCGRGLLHLGILLENMRREGYELQVSKPEMITREVQGELCEPVEIASVDVPNEYVGRCIELFGLRRGIVEKVDQKQERTHLLFRVPARGLVGLQSKLLSATRGQAVLHSSYEGYEPWKGELPGRGAGVLIAMEKGEAASYAIDNLQSRGLFFVGPGTKVYEGMIVGEHCKDKDLVVNVAKKKRLSNMRTSTADMMVVLQAPRIFSLEEALEYLSEDELLEITPKSIRLRKKTLSASMRRREGREAAAEEEDDA